MVRIVLREVFRLADVDQTSAEMAALAAGATDAALAEMLLHDFTHRLGIDAVVKDWPRVDVEGGAVVAAIAAGGRQQFDLASQSGLGNRRLQLRPELLATPFAAVGAKAEVDPIS